MRAKTIKAVLRKKFDDFVGSIDNLKVRNMVKSNSIITGGSIASMMLDEEVNDYDIYFTNAETVLAVVEYYTTKFNKTNEKYDFNILNGIVNNLPDNYEEQGIVPGRIMIRVVGAGVAAEEDFTHGEDPNSDNDGHFEKPDDDKEKYRPVYISANAITLSDKIQLIIRFFGDAEEIHKNYDFVHCTCWWTSDDGYLELPGPALECLLSKELRYQGSRYPLASIIRTRKFINRGFTINAGQYLKMCMQLNDLELRNLAVLSDQLTGVDAYYFNKMMDCVDGEKLKDDIDGTYLMGIINKFF